MSSRYRNSCAQRGATLIVALLVVLATVALATRMGSDWLLQLRALESRLEQEQARAWLRGAETLAGVALVVDLQTGSRVDAPVEAWAAPLELPLPEGLLQACLVDLQGKLDLNTLGAPQEAGYSVMQKRFIRLLQALPLQTALTLDQALSLANAVFDWVDTDSSTRSPGGAESQDYLRVGAAYRAANQGFVSVAELILVQGFDAGLVAALTPHLSVWGNGALNLNALDTGPGVVVAASDKSPPVLLRTLNTGDSLLPLSEQGAALLRDQRAQRGGVFLDLAVFEEGPFALQRWELDQVDVASDYFALHARVRGARYPYYLNAVLQRYVGSDGNPATRVRAREFSSYDHGVWPCAGELSSQ